MNYKLNKTGENKIHRVKVTSGSGSVIIAGSGSVIIGTGSANPDPDSYQNETDLIH